MFLENMRWGIKHLQLQHEMHADKCDRGGPLYYDRDITEISSLHVRDTFILPPEQGGLSVEAGNTSAAWSEIGRHPR